jgi:hypothetical protein
MSRAKICHRGYHWVSEGETLLPPPKQPFVFLFLDDYLFRF